MDNIKKYRLTACFICFFGYVSPAISQSTSQQPVTATFSIPNNTQPPITTTFGIPSSSPGVFWPRGSSIESLGFGRLYPNGPEFGLSNTSGGFGLLGSGPVSGVGLAEKTVPTFVQEQMSRSYSNTMHLTDTFNRERAAFKETVLTTAISNEFRSEMQKSRTAQNKEIPIPDVPLQLNTQLTALPSVDRVLQDQMPNTDAILKTGL